MRANLDQRLEQVEKAVSAVRDTTRAQAEDNERLQCAWEIMRATMREEHVALVLEAFAAGMHNGVSEEYSTPGGRLSRRCLRAMQDPRSHWPDDEIPAEVALAMPPEVAEVYMFQDVLPLHDCADCGYRLPFGFFEVCPLCGGRIGYYAYWKRCSAEQKKPGAT